MLLKDKLQYKFLKQVDITDITQRLSEIDPALWDLDISRQAYGAYGMGPVSRTKNLILNYCLGEPKADMKKALELKNMFPDQEIPRKYMIVVFPDIYRSVAEFKQDINNIEKRIVDEQLNQYTDVIIADLEKELNGRAGLVIYEKLPAQQEIREHIDSTYYLNAVHRFYLPIITNERVQFNFEDNTFNFEEGSLYEINNQVKHGVKNLSDSDAVHLIIDIIPNT